MCCSEICEIKCTAGCEHYLGKSLFFMGEFGVNDYSFSVFGKTLPQIRSLVPDVVNTISAATEVTRITSLDH